MAVILVLSLVVIGALVAYFRQSLKDIDEYSESDFNIADQNIKEHYIELCKAEAIISEIESTLKDQQHELQARERVLLRVQECLSKSTPGSTITIGNRSQTWEQLEQDSQDDFAACKILREQCEIQKQSLCKLRREHKNSLKVISGEQEKLWRAKMNFYNKKAELATLAKQQEASDIISRSVDIKTNPSVARWCEKNKTAEKATDDDKSCLDDDNAQPKK